MDPTTTKQLDVLRRALLALKPSGPDGFEGLVAAALSDACGQPFRLATSGSQRGRDGDSAFDDGATYFEAKRYQDAVPKEQIAVKLADLAADNAGQVDTWVLCSTVETGAQKAADFRATAESLGIGLLLLDWSDNSLPPLATLLGIARAKVKNFLHAYSPGRAARACAAIDHVVSHSDFVPFANSQREQLRTASIGLGLAKAANHHWLQRLFSNRTIARQHLGQFLAPKDPKALILFDRPELETLVRRAFTGNSERVATIVMGDEGAGKSWLVAKSWLATNPASMLAVTTAKELEEPRDVYDIEGFVIRLLIRETNNDNRDASTVRWKRRLKNWASNPDPSNVRLTVWIDGLEQAPAFPWARWIDAAALFLHDRGCRLIVTTRSSHYSLWRNALDLKFARIVVPNWSPEELEEILTSLDIKGNTLNPDVFNTLRNPRILEIAVRLLDAQSIENINELSVDRLLFEHVRQSDQTRATPLSGLEFTKTLQELAEAIVGKLKIEQLDDYRLVDTRLSDRIRDIASSRFFDPLEGDPDFYTIRKDGLQLALALWLVSALEKHHRNERDPAQELTAVLEPISALDMTAHVVACAAEVACLKDGCPLAVSSALLQLFVSLQNAHSPRHEAMVGLARKAPKAFLQALEDAALSLQHINNIDWLLVALRESRDDSNVWNAISERVPRWLSIHSLSPDQKTFSASSRDNPEKAAEEHSKASAKISETLAALSHNERTLLDTQVHRNDDIDPEDLHRYALRLLAGKPLTSFALAFVVWAFGHALKSSAFSPREEFQQLLRMNVCDWTGTRDALHGLIVRYFKESRSRTGAWALVEILRATGDTDDAKEAHELAEQLTKDREHFGSWRLIETYCETDPCDPSSTRGNRVSQTALRFEALQASEFRPGLGTTKEDIFFQDTLPALARFEPDVAIATIRRLATDAPQREEPARRFAVFSLLPHAAVFEMELVEAFIAAAQEFSPSAHEDIREAWVSAQYALLIGLSHRDGASQLEVIRDLHGYNLLIRLLEALKPADIKTVENSLGQAVKARDEDMQVRVLSVINYTSAPLSSNTKAWVAELFQSKRVQVRTQALGVIVDSADSVLLKAVVESDWPSSTLNADKDQYELYFGSTALLMAAKEGLSGIEKTLDRISLTHYGRAAVDFGPKVAAAVAERVSSALGSALGFRAFPSLPDIERQAVLPHDQTPNLVRITDIAVPNERVPEESEHEYATRQRRAQTAYRDFSREVTSADARLILTDLGFDGVAALVAARPELVDPWVDGLIHSAEPTRRALYLFAVELMSAIAASRPNQALALWNAIEPLEPLVRHVTGAARIPVDRLALWQSADVPALRAECFRLLDQASSDYAIAVEVLAAFSAGRGKEIAAYVDALLQSSEPSTITRALTVSGLSDQNEQANTVLNRFSTDVGFIGAAAVAARYAYDRNAWSRHWFDAMAAATNPKDFWRYSVLLEKIVDGRFVIWNRSKAMGETCQRFYATIEDRIESRIRNWEEKRRNQLFGNKVPIATYLPPAGRRDIARTN